MATAKVNGAELYYEEAGSGPPIILSPGGLQGVASSYGEVVEALSQEHRVIVYDRRFGGQSRSPMVVQTWDMVCDDVFGLLDALGIEQAYLGGGSFGAAISFGSAYRHPERVRAIFPSNIAGGVICDGYLTSKLFKSMEIAAADGISAVIDAFDADDRFAPFSPEIAQTDAEYRKGLEAMDTEEFIQVMRDSIYALFGGPFPDPRQHQGHAEEHQRPDHDHARLQRRSPPRRGRDGPSPRPQQPMGRVQTPLRRTGKVRQARHSIPLASGSQRRLVA